MSVTSAPLKTREGEPLDTFGEEGTTTLYGEAKIIQLLEDIAKDIKHTSTLLELLIGRI